MGIIFLIYSFYSTLTTGYPRTTFTLCYNLSGANV